MSASDLPTVSESTLSRDEGFAVRVREDIAAGYRRVTYLGIALMLGFGVLDIISLDDPALVYDLRDRGVLLQVTTGSLAGLFGSRSQALAVHLLQDGAVDVLASDAHSAGRRYVSVTEGLAYAEELVGQSRVRQLTTDNPRALLGDQELEPPVQTGARASAEHHGRQPLARTKQLISRR